MAMRGAIAYSAFRRSKTHLVYTTEDLRVRFVDRTHFFGRAHPEKRAYALPIGKVGLGGITLSADKRNNAHFIVVSCTFRSVP